MFVFLRAADRVPQSAKRTGHQQLILTDSRVALRLCHKGGGERAALNRIGRRLAALSLRYRQVILYRGVSTKTNFGDGPSISVD